MNSVVVGRLTSLLFSSAIGQARALILAAAAVLAGALVLSGPATAAEKGLFDANRAIYRQAFAAADRGKWDEARRLAARSHDKLAAKVIAWREMRAMGNNVPFADIARFIDDNPDWPGMDQLRRRAEEAIDEATPSRLVLAWFGKREPVTFDGRVALARALEATGKTAEARAQIRRAWVTGDFNSKQEVRFVKQFGKQLTEADHRARLDRLLWNGKSAQAERMLRRVPPDYRPVAIARMRLHEMSASADAAVRRIPKQYVNDPGFLYERLRWRRRKGRDEEAMEILRHPPKNMVRPDRWWDERALIARRMLAKGNITDAMRAASEHGLSPGDGERYIEAEWMAGWISLRFLDDKAAALARFEHLYKAVKTPASQARAAYWAARAAKALGRTQDAMRWYTAAAHHVATYYGQLAAHYLGTEPKPAAVPADATPDPAHIAAFNRSELVRVARMLHDVGNRHELESFMLQLAKVSADPAQKVLAARLARTFGRTDLGVRIARTAYRDGVLLLADGYPVIPTPDGKPERALLLAIARQESNFNPKVESWAGARGLMQLMPATAKSVARIIKDHYAEKRLTDATYNMKLGRAYLGMLLDQFNGSYVLALGAYNAGPGNVSKWVRAYGDPRDTQVDAVDWVEMIPYNETRNYVQQVMANLQVYRQRVGAPQLASMAQDLRR